MEEARIAAVVFSAAEHKDLVLRGVPRELQDRGSGDVSAADRTKVRELIFVFLRVALCFHGGRWSAQHTVSDDNPHIAISRLIADIDRAAPQRPWRILRYNKCFPIRATNAHLERYGRLLPMAQLGYFAQAFPRTS